jgi:hypothetical protein
MSQVAGLFNKWQRWMRELTRLLQNVLAFHFVGRGFVASLLPHEGKSRRLTDIQFWMLINHVNSTTIAIRRLADEGKRNKKSVSLRNLLENMKTNCHCFTAANMAKHCPHFKQPGITPQLMEKDIKADIDLVTTHTERVHDFVDKMIAHNDPMPLPADVPDLQELDQAIVILHKVFRKWAWILLATDYNPHNPDPLEMLHSDPPDFTHQFRQMWNALDQCPDTRWLLDMRLEVTATGTTTES